MIDPLIASIAIAHGIPLYTANPEDFVGLESILKVLAVSR
jgi:predicted nucleic acid-binding protein